MHRTFHQRCDERCDERCHERANARSAAGREMGGVGVRERGWGRGEGVGTRGPPHSHALIEAPRFVNGKPHGIEFYEDQPRSLNSTPQPRCVHDIELDAVRAQ